MYARHSGIQQGQDSVHGTYVPAHKVAKTSFEMNAMKRSTEWYEHITGGFDSVLWSRK